jgi:hypothetical protein
MEEHESFGAVAIASKLLCDRGIARLVGCPEVEVPESQAIEKEGSRE